MITALVALVGGVVVLAWSADQFVLGAARVALIRRVPTLVVGVVIVGFGTSAPELLVSALAAARGEPEIAIGNIVGSNVANLSLLLGLGALVVPLAVASRTVRREAPLVVGAVMLFGLVVQGSGITRVEGALLLVAMVTALAVVIRRSETDPLAIESEQFVDPLAVESEQFADPVGHPLGWEIARTVVGLLGTVGAAQLLLWGALRLADLAGLSAGFVGATVVAVGTSLPELVTVVQSARRSETDLIVGNLLGSNLFNALTVGGVVGLIDGTGLDAPKLTIVAAGAAVVVALAALVAMVTSSVVGRREGAALLVGYVVLLPLLA